jgi:hypothetical protein
MGREGGNNWRLEMVEKLPIVYVRGFAGDTSGINKAVADPFYGFNEGSTHVRVGGDGEPIFYQFESPLLRLHLDEDYQILVQDCAALPRRLRRCQGGDVLDDTGWR